MTQNLTTEIKARVAELLLPPKRETVAEAAENYVYLNTPGGYSGPWSNELPHYMIEPAQCLTAREFTGVIFVGPAQTAKTAMLVENWAAHSIICDPGDMMIVQTSQDEARDFSKRRVDRMHENCPEIKKRLRPGGQSDNTHDKMYRSGMILTIKWPTKNTLAGKPIGKMALTDYDRFPEDIGGEGAAYNLAETRTKTFMSRGMTMAESSPSKEVVNADWRVTAERAHEAPPTKGILGLYNTGDRRRLYCKCQHCGDYWMPTGDISDIYIPESSSLDEKLNGIGLICPSGCINGQDVELDLKKTWVWLKEGQSIDADGVVTGVGRTAARASFWMTGWAAAFNRWRDIVRKYLQALESYELTQDEDALKSCYNTEMGIPFISFARRNTRSASDIQDKAEPLTKRTVPQGVRFLTASVDVQKRSFEVQVQGWGVNRESWVVDRFSITMAKRTDDGNPVAVDPASYIEDWGLLIDQVINKNYPLDDGSGREMSIKRVRCDSGGADGVTDNAYNFWRKCKKLGLGVRFQLLKGGSTKNAPRVKIARPDNQGKKARKSSARGDVPVLMLNTDAIKDSIDASLKRDEFGQNYIHFPDWLPDSYFEELSAEKKTDKGWKKEPGSVNDSWDLLCYNLATAIELGIEKINWDSPPAWAAEWESNNNFPLAQKAQPKINPFASNAHKSTDPYLS